jgi:hypothetical protein
MTTNFIKMKGFIKERKRVCVCGGGGGGGGGGFGCALDK